MVRPRAGPTRPTALVRRRATGGLCQRREVTVCDAATGKVVHTLRVEDKDREFTGLLGFDAAGDRLVASLNNGEAVAAFSLKRGGHTEIVETGVRSAEDVSPDGRTLVFMNGGPSLALFDVPTGRFRTGWTFPPPPRRACGGGGIYSDGNATGFSPDGSFFLSWADWGTLVLWDPVTGEPERVIATGTPTGDTALSPDGLWLAIATWNQVSLWDVPTGQQLFAWEVEPGPWLAGVYFAGPGRLLTTLTDHTALLWDVAPRRSRPARLGRAVRDRRPGSESGGLGPGRGPAGGRTSSRSADRPGPAGADRAIQSMARPSGFRRVQVPRDRDARVAGPRPARRAGPACCPRKGDQRRGPHAVGPAADAGATDADAGGMAPGPGRPVDGSRRDRSGQEGARRMGRRGRRGAADERCEGGTGASGREIARSLKRSALAVRWRMPSSLNPIAADEKRVRIGVESKKRNCCPSDRSPADDAKSVGRPRKVIAPALRSGVEQRLLSASRGVHPSHPISFGSVAKWATEPEVRLIGGTAPAPRNQVLDL